MNMQSFPRSQQTSRDNEHLEQRTLRNTQNIHKETAFNKVTHIYIYENKRRNFRWTKWRTPTKFANLKNPGYTLSAQNARWQWQENTQTHNLSSPPPTDIVPPPPPSQKDSPLEPHRRVKKNNFFHVFSMIKTEPTWKKESQIIVNFLLAQPRGLFGNLRTISEAICLEVLLSTFSHVELFEFALLLSLTQWSIMKANDLLKARRSGGKTVRVSTARPITNDRTESIIRTREWKQPAEKQ